MSALLLFLFLVAGFIVVGNFLSGRSSRDRIYSFPVDDSPSSSGESDSDFSFDDAGGDGGGHSD